MVLRYVSAESELYNELFSGEQTIAPGDIIMVWVMGRTVNTGVLKVNEKKKPMREA